MNKQLIIATGTYGAGKSTFARWYARRMDGLYIEHDLIHKGIGFNEFIDRLASVVNKTTKGICILDGWGDYPARFSELEDRIDSDIKLCFCFASPDIIRQRQATKKSKVNNTVLPEDFDKIIGHIFDGYALVLNSPYENMFVDTTDAFEVLNGKISQRIRDRIFLSGLIEQPHDKYYQDIELPSGIGMEGYTKSYKTWERLKLITDYSGKSVLDVGCFHGYFCFKVEEAGAGRIIGIDVCSSAVHIAQYLSQLKYSRCEFIESKAEDFQPDIKYDIVFCLNMLHHVDDVRKVLSNVFNAGSLVVFEVHSKELQYLQNTANLYGFDNLQVMTSHRAGRVILVCSKSITEDILIPLTRYRYNYHREVIKHRIYILGYHLYKYTFRLWKKLRGR